jgi:hypothetical protein
VGLALVCFPWRGDFTPVVWATPVLSVSAANVIAVAAITVLVVIIVSLLA